MSDQAGTMPCPKCAGRMQAVTVGGVEVDRCHMCRGIWFDAKEFMELKAVRGAESVDDGSPFIGSLKDGVTNIDCPVCKVPMIPFRPPNAVREFTLERCPQCQGMFFDAGEFTDFTLDASFWNELK